MKPDKMSDYEYSIITNFKFKNKYSPNSLEKMAYDKMVSFDDHSRTVASREKAQQWVSKLLSLTRESIENIYEIQASDEPVNKKVLIDQEKMKVLYAMDWSYSSSFLVNAEETFTDKNGKERTYAEAYPELSFVITVRKVGDKYWFMPQYGIMHGVESADYGSYTYFATLDETVEFINDELLIIGRKALQNRLDKAYADRTLRSSREKKMNLGSDAYAEAVKANRPKVNKMINKMIVPDVIEERLYKIKRSTDIFTLPDLIEEFLLDIAAKYLNLAKESEYRQIQAKQIQDTVVLDLDEDFDAAPATDIAEENKKLPSPDSLGRDIDRKVAQRNAAVSSDTETPSIITPDDVQGESHDDAQHEGLASVVQEKHTVFSDDDSQANTVISVDDEAPAGKTPEDNTEKKNSSASAPLPHKPNSFHMHTVSVNPRDNVADIERNDIPFVVSLGDPADGNEDIVEDTITVSVNTGGENFPDIQDQTCTITIADNDDYTDIADGSFTLNVHHDDFHGDDFEVKTVDEFFVENYNPDNTEPLFDHKKEVINTINELLDHKMLPVRSSSNKQLSSDLEDLLS